MDSDKGDTLVMRIQFFPAASDAKNIAISETVLRNDVRLFKTYAEDWFDYHHAAAAGGSMSLELEVGVRPASSPPDPTAHQIAVTNDPDLHSEVDDRDLEFGSSYHGTWSIRSLISDKLSGLHEIGHLADLPDAYTDFFTRSDGSQVVMPPTMASNVEGKVLDPQNWGRWGQINGVDVYKDRVRSKPNPGHEHDLMGDHYAATGLHPDWLERLRTRRSDCNRSVVHEVVSARTCYTAPNDLPTKYPGFLPHIRIADTPTAVDRYPALAGRRFKLRIACSFKNERFAVLDLLKWSKQWASKAKALNAELQHLQPQLSSEGYQALDAQVQQASLNAGALMHEASYRSSVVMMLVIGDRPGYGTVSVKRIKRLARSVRDFIRKQAPA